MGFEIYINGDVTGKVSWRTNFASNDGENSDTEILEISSIAQELYNAVKKIRLLGSLKAE